MNILITNPPTIFEGKNYCRVGARWPAKKSITKSKKDLSRYTPFPFFMAYTSAVLKQDNHNVSIIDASSLQMPEQEFYSEVKKRDPELVLMEFSTPTINLDLRYAKKLKEITGAKIILAGPHASALPQEMLKNKFIDFVAIGEYEYTIKELANELEKSKPNFSKIKGLAYKNKINPRRELIESLDDLPYPDRDSFPIDTEPDLELYWDGFCEIHPAVQVVTSRGCPFNCNYCIDGRELVLIRENNLIKTKRVHEFVDPILNTEGASMQPIINKEIWNNGKFTRLTKISRRCADKLIYEIGTERGRCIHLSREHIVPVILDGKEITKRVSELKVGDNLKINIHIEFANTIKEIDLIQEINQCKIPDELLRDIYIQNLSKLFEFLRNKKDYKKLIKNELGINLNTNQVTNHTLPLQHFNKIVDYFRPQKELLENIFVGGKNILPTPSRIKITDKLIRLLGYFVAEGNYGYRNLVITSENKFIREDLEEIIHSIFPNSYISKVSNQFTFGGLIPYVIFRYILGIKKGAKNKNIPDIVFNVTKKLRAELLRALFSGDGDFSHRKCRYSTISEVLKEQVALLLLEFGINYSIQKTNPKVKKIKGRIINQANNLYRIVIASWDDRQKFLENIGFIDGRYENLREFQKDHKPRRVEVLQHLNYSKTVSQLAEEIHLSRRHIQNVIRRLGSKFIKKDYGANHTAILSKSCESNYLDNRSSTLKIKKIAPVSPSSEWLYDFETEDHYLTVNSIQVHNCLWPQVMYPGRRFRTFSAKRVVDEMELVRNKYKAKMVYFDDDTFTGSKQHVLGICDEIKKRKLNIPWSCMADAMITDEEMIRKMVGAGCISIKFGVESADYGVLKRIGKPINLEKVIQFSKWCRKYKLRSHATFCFGMTGDTLESMQKTLYFACKLDVDSVQFSTALAYPGTRFWDEAEKNSWFKWEDGSSQPVINYSNLSYEKIKEFHDKADAVWKRAKMKDKKWVWNRLKRTWKYRGFEGVKFLFKRGLSYL